MDSNLFSQINTTIAVKENSFITVDTFQKMLLEMALSQIHFSYYP